MSVYGLKFKIRVIESLKTLSLSKKEATLTEVLEVFIQQTEPKPTKRYKASLRSRVRICLWEWSDLKWCSIERRKHPINNYLVLYYTYDKETETERGGQELR